MRINSYKWGCLAKSLAIRTFFSNLLGLGARNVKVPGCSDEETDERLLLAGRQEGHLTKASALLLPSTRAQASLNGIADE